jgi:hypothetical protein
MGSLYKDLDRIVERKVGWCTYLEKLLVLSQQNRVQYEGKIYID